MKTVAKSLAALGAAALLVPCGFAGDAERQPAASSSSASSAAAAPARPSASTNAPTSGRAGQARALAFRADDASLKWGPCPPLFAPGCEIAVLQGDPSQPNADVFFRIPGGYRIAPHSHTSAEHMVLVAGELEVQYRGQPAVRLRTGSYAYGPPQLPHAGRCVSRDPCTLFIAFEQPVDALPYQGSL